MKIITFLCVLSLIGFVFGENKTDIKPVVIWHGMGDSCCFPFSMGRIKKLIEREVPGIYVLSLQIGDSIPSDVENGYFMLVKKQLEIAHDLIVNDPKLKNGFNSLGFSQGGLFLRALAQKYSSPAMYNLISMGGPQQGVYGIPNCGSVAHETCNYIRKLLNYAAYKSWVQNYLVQATYWHDPLNEKEYRKGSIFLADINNENVVNQTYINNLQKLNKFVMVRFENDTTVQPRDTEWFYWYKPGQAVEVQKLQDTYLYEEDRLGLKYMDEQKKLVFLETPGDHLQFTDDWFVENIINKYFK
ncbi:palmitoyl-protein thioesterase 1 isoform X2 [Chrysoperla carnea]|uniref:palmitoyl-protein thioesterase 1 isoform X2 n=1 Tax=Chrysoperla carnea TaxID=189513 RepID=UPI001D08F5DE|nr:palmitoyl-protein thioesterase 1 isoform X2 [Chrysoperla carnea]